MFTQYFNSREEISIRKDEKFYWIMKYGKLHKLVPIPDIQTFLDENKYVLKPLTLTANT